jgi:hypothetical protein
MGEPLRERASEDERFDFVIQVATGLEPISTRLQTNYVRGATRRLIWRSVRHYCGAIDPDVEMVAEKRDSTS